MTVPQINKVCYVGAGTMGCYNSLVAALCGYQVILYDVDEVTLARVGQRHSEFAALLVGGAYCSEEHIPPALARIATSSDLGQATGDVDLVSESVFERLELKRDIHRELDKACDPRTIITTNSSALQVSQIEDVYTDGKRFAALHSHLGSPLVDIVGGPRTDPAVVALLERYVLSLGGVPLVLRKEHPGYVLNAMLGPVLSTALALVLTNSADIETVDRAWIGTHKAAMGPFGMIDLFGLELIRDSWQYKGDELYHPALREQALGFLQAYIERGDLGMKAGRGFYQYPQPAYQQPCFLEPGDDLSAITAALNVALIANAVAIAAAGVAGPQDIDRAWTVGTHLETGPFEILANMGQKAFTRAMEREVAARRLRADSADSITAYLDSQ